MATAASALSPPPAQGGTANDDSNISSPLSDVDDKDGNDDDIEHMQLDRDDDDDDDAADSSSPAAEEAGSRAGDGSDSESALSDAQSEDNFDDNDTEAETERLYDTPRNPRHRDVTDENFAQEQPFEHTPSKLRTIAIAGKAGDDSDAESLSEDEGSPTSKRQQRGASPTDEAGEEDEEEALSQSQQERDRKRKRSSGAEQSDSEQPSRKRPASVAPNDNDRHDEGTAVEADVTSLNPQSTAPSNGDDLDTPFHTEDIAGELQDEEPARLTRATRNGGRKQASDEESSHKAEQYTVREGTEAQPDDGNELRDDDREDEVEEEVDQAAKNAEELERKLSAMKDFDKIEEMFAEFRHRLYRDRLQRLEEEEQSLLSSTPTHPEFLNMKRCLDERLEQKLHDIKTEDEFRMQAHQRRAVAQRAQIWGQFFQAVRERREQTLEALNKEWYDVQSARRSAHSLPDSLLLFPKDTTQRLRNAVAYNSEVSTLSGLAKYEGFPAGPEIRGASSSEMEDDFALMEHHRREQAKPSRPSREEFQAPTFHHLGPAGEQFLKDTPWANPYHSAHRNAQQHPHAEARDVPTASASSRAPLPSGPQPDHRTVDKQNYIPKTPAAFGRISTSPELTRSMINQSAPLKRIANAPNVGRGSKTATA